MGMAVGQFLFGSGAYRENLHLELQITTGQRMVGVYHRLGQADLDHGNLARTLLGLDNRQRARFPFSGALQVLYLDLLGGIGLDRAVGLVHRQLDREAVAGLAAFHGFYQAFEQAGLAMQVEHRLRSEEHTAELQSRPHLVCRLLLEKKKNQASATSTRSLQHPLTPLPLVCHVRLLLTTPSTPLWGNGSAITVSPGTRTCRLSHAAAN